MNRSESIKEIAAALAKAQLKFAHAEKSATNPHFNKKYADLTAVIDACREALCENGISFTQSPAEINSKWLLETTIFHSSGEWMQSHVPILCSKNDSQGFGSGLTYARRYGLAAMVGVGQEDDDGNAATGKGNKENQHQKSNAKPAAQKQSAPPQQRPPPTSADDESIVDYIDRPLTAMEKVELSKWVMPGGKFANKKLGEVPQEEVLAYYAELKKAADAGQHLSDGHKMLMQKFAQYYSDLI